MSGGPGINPLAGVLLAASLAPLGLAWWRRRLRDADQRKAVGWGWPGAWAALGLAGTALLTPALAIPDGVPSPAALLGELAPWQQSVGAGDAERSPGNPERSPGNRAAADVVHQIQPWLLFLRDELRAGRLPWWNPYQYAGTPFWSNGQGAPLFPLHLLFAALPLPAGWLLLPWLRVLIGGLGARALARELGVGPLAALAAGLIYPLSGMTTSFLLYPMGNALALVPWVLWAVERVARAGPAEPEGPAAGRPGGSGVVALAVAVGLQLLAGHPETVVHTVLLSAVYLLVRGVGAGGWWGQGARRVTRVGGRLAAGWLLGAGVAAVQIVPLAATLAVSSRWQRPPGEFAEPLLRLLAQPLRLVLPDLYGHPVDGSWWGPYNYLATAVYAGAFALPLAAAGLLRIRRRPGDGGDGGAPGGRLDRRWLDWPWLDRRWLGVAVVLGVSLAGAYHLPGVRELLAALPVVGRAAHHRLLFGVELTLALLAAGGLQLWLDRPAPGDVGWRRGRTAAWTGGAVAAALLAVGWWRFAGEWAGHGTLGRQLAATVSVLAATLVVGGLWQLRPLLPHRRWTRGAAAAVLVLVPLELISVHARFNPGLPAADLYPVTPAVRFLQDELAAAGEGRIAATGSHLRPNAAMVYRLADVRGDDTVKLASYERFAAATFGSGHPNFFRPIRRWDPLWLDRLSVRWVLGAPGRPPPAGGEGWRRVYDGADARVWERPDPLPMVRWAGPVPGEAGRLEVVERGPGRWLLRWALPQRRLLVVGEAWDAGWRAREVGADGAGSEELPVRAAGDVLVGVELGPGDGVLELVYRPVGIGWGAGLSAAAVALLAVLAWRPVRRRRALGGGAGS